jgi:23S rRNA (pseudouridine1915-N3)-methyltransferase
MKITLIAMGQRMEPWIQEGFSFYQKRFPPSFSLILKEIPLLKRTPKSFIPPILEEEGKAMLSAIPQGDTVIALDAKGTLFDSEKLAQKLQHFQDTSQNISLLIGSPEGMPQACSARADQQWSLSPLTLPHPLVRLMITEALYRSWCILNHHPYHK